MSNLKNKLTIGMILIFLSIIFSVSVNASGAYDPKSSGIKQQFYFVEWCPAHKEVLKDKQIKGCIQTQLSSTGSYTTMGSNLKDPLTTSGTGDTVADTKEFLKTATSIKELQPSNTVPLFIDGSSDFQIVGEGTFKIVIILVDNAGNVGKNEILYKIDKTAPKFWLHDIFEYTDLTYKTITDKESDINVQKFDSSGEGQLETITSNGEYVGQAYKVESAINYTEKPVLLNKKRSKLHTIYFRDKDEKIDLQPLFSDSFLDELNKNYISNSINKIKLLDNKDKQLVENFISLGTTEIKVSTLNLAKNTQGLFKIRVYDSSCDESGDNCNYVETAFYAVRDNTAPNIDSSNDKKKAINKLLLFTDDISSYDTTTTGHDNTDETKAFSKFIVASEDRQLKYKLDDVGIGNGTADKEYALYNAGISTGATVYIENNDFKDDLTVPFFSFTGSSIFKQTINKARDFSNVDIDREDAGYRKYSTKYETSVEYNTDFDGLCDNVGNCLKPQMTYRVIAGNVDNTESTLSYSGSSNSKKAFADSTTQYNLGLQLKDKFGNIVTPVTSDENNDAKKVRDIETKLTFTNGLFSDLRTTSGTGSKLAVVKNKDSNDNLENNINIDAELNLKLTEQTNGKKQDGKYKLSIGSEVPTHIMYPYISTGAILKLDKIDFDNDNFLNNSIGYKLNDELNPTKITFIDTIYNSSFDSSTGYINNNGVNPLESDYDFNLNYFDSDSDSYGEITGGIDTATGLTNIVKNINFEFASPIIYGMKGFSLLVDGQYNPHTKKIYKFGDGVSEFNIFEKILVGSGNGDIKDSNSNSNKIFDYDIRYINNINSSENINNGLYLNNNFASDDDKKSNLLFNKGNLKFFNLINLIENGIKVEIQQSTIPDKVYDNSKLKSGFVSALKYESKKGSMVYLPALARNISGSKFVDSIENQYQMARNYFDGNYFLGDNSISLNNFVTDIGIVGLSYTGKDDLTTNSSHDKGSVDVKNIGGKLTRYDLFKTFKKNVAKYSGGKTWCKNASYSDLSSCTQTINGEEVSFVKGDLDIDCGNTCTISNKRTIIVMDGKLTLKSNITTLDDDGKQTGGKLLLGVITKNGLSDVSGIGDNTYLSDLDLDGWMLIDKKVTNIDAELVVQGPVISTDIDNNYEVYTKNNLTGTKLRNQLYIYGSILSLNNIGGSRSDPYKCPYIIGNCNKNTSQIYDLNYLRRFALIKKSYFTGNDNDNDKSIPYHPEGLNGDVINAKRSGKSKDGSEILNLRNVPYNYDSLPLIISRNRDNSKASIFTIAN